MEPQSFMSVEVGKVYWIQEAFSILIGTVKQVTPFSIVLSGDDACWVRDLGQMTDFMNSGDVNEFHAIPRDVEIKDHAIRYLFESPHKSPVTMAAGGSGRRRNR